MAGACRCCGWPTGGSSTWQSPPTVSACDSAAPPAEPPAEPPAKEPATPEPEVDPLTGLPISSTKKRVVAPKAGLFDEDEEKEV